MLSRSGMWICSILGRRPCPAGSARRSVMVASGTAERICYGAGAEAECLYPIRRSRRAGARRWERRTAARWFPRSAAATALHRRGARDGAQDFGAGGLPILHGAQLGLQPGILLPEISHHVRGKRGHSLKSICTGPGGTAPNQQERAGPEFNFTGRSVNSMGVSIIPSLAHRGQRHLWSRLSRKRRLVQVPGLETSVSLEVMNSSSTGMPSLVFWMPRLIAGMMSSGFVTRSPWPPKARAIAA